jgi:hypothetical protein
MLEKIKKAGGFVDFGKIGSMPLGYLADGTALTTTGYHKCQKLIASEKIKKAGKMTNQNFRSYLTRTLIEGDLYK